MTNFQSNSKDPWEPCRPGTIAKLADVALHDDKVARRRFLFQIAGISGTTLGVAGIAAVSLNWFGSGPSKSGLPGGVACVTVHQHLADFVADQIGDLELRANISRHLFQCPSCQKAFQALNEGEEFDCTQQPDALS